MNQNNCLSEIFSVSSSKSSHSKLPPPLEEPTKPVSVRIASPVIRASSLSPTSRWKNSLIQLQRRLSKSPSMLKETHFFTEPIKDFEPEIDKYSEEVLLNKRNKHTENYIAKQKRLFEGEFNGFQQHQESLALFQKTSGRDFKNLLDGILEGNRQKKEKLEGFERTLMNFKAKNKGEKKEGEGKLQDFYTKIAMVRENEGLAVEFLMQLKGNLEELGDKATVQLIGQEQLENLYNNLKREVSLKEQSYKDLFRLYELLDSQQNDFAGRVFPVRRNLEQLCIKGSQLELDLVSDRLFQDNVLIRKQTLSTLRQKELKNTILEFAGTRKDVLNAKKRLKEQEKEMEELDKMLAVKKAEKISNRSLLNALDYIDRISHCFLYNDPEEFDLEAAVDIDREPEKKNESAFLKLERLGSSRSINSGFSSKGVKEVRTFLNVLSKLKKSPAGDVNTSQTSVFLNKRTVFTEKNAKRVGIERIERFYNKHNGDIPGLFDRIVSVYQKLIIEEESLKTRIEDLNEQKGRLFDGFTQNTQRLLELFSETSKDIRDQQIQRHEARMLAFGNELGNLNEAIGTLNQLKVDVNSKEEFLKTLNVQDIREVQSVNIRILLFLHEVILRFCAIIKGVMNIKAQSREIPAKDVKFLEYINLLANKSLINIDENYCNECPQSPGLKTPKQRKKIPLENTRQKDLEYLLRTNLKEYPEEAQHCRDILILDFILSSFTSVREFKQFLQDFLSEIEKYPTEEQRKMYFMDTFGDKIAELKEQSQANCLNKYRELLEDFEEFLGTLRNKTHQQKDYLKAMERLETGPVSSMEELVQEIDSRKEIEDPTPKATTQEKNKDSLILRRLEILQRAGNIKISSNNFTTPFNISTDVSAPEEDDRFFEILGVKVKEEMLLEEEKKRREPVKVEVKPLKKKVEKGFMKELKKNRTEIRELLTECLHNNKKFSGILTAIESEERRKNLLKGKQRLKDPETWLPQDVCQREIMRKLHFLRPEDRPKTAVQRIKKPEIVRINNETVKKRPVTGFLKVNQRSLSPRDFRISPPREFVVMRGIRGEEGTEEDMGEKKKENNGKKIGKMEILRKLYSGKGKREGSV